MDCLNLLTGIFCKVVLASERASRTAANQEDQWQRLFTRFNFACPLDIFFKEKWKVYESARLTSYLWKKIHESFGFWSKKVKHMVIQSQDKLIALCDFLLRSYLKIKIKICVSQRAPVDFQIKLYQRLFTPYKIYPLSSRQLMRIKAIINCVL